jgi:amino acid adenylation domain-containing protein
MALPLNNLVDWDPAAVEVLLAGEAARILRLDPARLAPDRPLTALGLDSLAAVELAAGIEAATGIEISLAGLLSGASVAAVAAEVLAGLAARQAPAVRTPTAPTAPTAPHDLPGAPQPPPQPRRHPEALEASEALEPLEPLEASASLGEQPLSAGQEALWFSDRLAPLAAAYNLAAAARVEGGLDPAALGRALEALADRHPALRTTFSLRSGEPRQIVHRHLAVDFQVEGAARAAADVPLAAEAYRPFDLERGPLLRVRLWRLAAPEAGWLLLLAVHHLVTDLWSLGLFVRELGAVYGEATGRRPAALAPLPFGYGDYVRWQEQTLAGDRGERLWDYWRGQLGGELPLLALAADRPRPAVQTYAGLSRGVRLAPALADRLRALGRAAGTTLFVTLLTGLQAFLNRYTGQDEVVIGSPTAGRARTPFLQVMGYFVNPVALRLAGRGASGDASDGASGDASGGASGDASGGASGDASGGVCDGGGGPTWRELLAAAQGVALAAFEHQALPFATIASRLRPKRDPGRSPLFQGLFVFQKAERPEERGMAELALGAAGARVALADLTLVSVPLPECRALFDFSLLVADAEAGLPAVLQLNRDLFDPATAERMLEHLANLLHDLAADPGARVAAANLLSAAERRQLAAWNDTSEPSAPAVELPRGLCLPDLFAAQAARTPGREAVVVGDERLTYLELARRAERLARRLRALGVGPETRVGVCARRSGGLVAALLAVHQAGGAYVPLDPVQPAARLAWMLADSGAAVLLVEETLAADAADLLAAGAPAGCQVVLLDGAADAGAADAGNATGTGHDAASWEGGGGGRPAAPRDPRLQPENLAYLIYTSGSTGRPKGVAIEQRSAVAFVRWARQIFSDAELSGVLAATPIGFDLSVFEIFVPLAWGGRVILAESALALPGLPAAAEVRLVNTVPSVLAELLREEDGPGLPPSVTTVNLAGEPLRRALARAVHGALPGARLLNLYGPTEDTTYSTWAEVTREEEGAPTIGRPIANTRAHLFDGTMRQVPVGVPGELHLGGAGLARGYHGRPDLTAERFVPDPLAAGQRLYRTGDLARRRADGELELLGRIDHQVKIRGVRVEPAEVEAALLLLPGVREAVVLVEGPRGDGAGDGGFRGPGDAGAEPRLVAFVVGAAGAEVSAAALRESLQGLLPRAMIPQAIVPLPGLPLTPNGKVDRRALARLAPGPSAGGGEEPAAVPRTPVEELLAGIWAEVLGVERVGSGDDFFDLGGHSLMALRVQARVRDRLGAELPLAAFFQFPTLAAQARRLAPAQTDGRPPLRRAPEGQTAFPLSFAQARLWLLERLKPGTAVYHMAGAARLTGPLAVAALGRALGEVVRRHDALRARFREVGGEPIQEIVPAASAPTKLPLVCLAGLAPARREAEAERLSRAAARRPFDLGSEAPLRLLLVRLEPRSHHLLLTLHHIAADEDSLTILAQELATLYGVQAGLPGVAASPGPVAPPGPSTSSGLTASSGSPGLLAAATGETDEVKSGLSASADLASLSDLEALPGLAALPARPNSPGLPPLPLRYVDFALAQREWLRGEALEPQVAWWRDRLADLPVVEMPADRPRQEVRSAAGAVVASALPPSLASALAALGRREGVTLFMFLLAAFQTVLGRTAGEPEVPVGSPVGGRDREALLPVIGFFVNTLVLRSGHARDANAVRAAGRGLEDPSFGGLLRRVRDITIQAHDHAGVPFEVLVQALRPERGLGSNPFFEVVFALQRPPRGWRLGDLTFAPRTVPTGTAKFDLTLFGIEAEGEVSFALEYAAEIFDRTTAARLLGHLEVFLAAAAAAPGLPVSALPFLSPAERQQLREWGLADQGRALAGIEVRVLDRDLRPVAAGTPGELYLGGAGIEAGGAAGAEWIPERFLPDPCGPPGARLCRTGERVRFRADGRLERCDTGRAMDRAAAAASGAAALGEADRIVAAVWQELLKVEAVHPDDNFFSLGGHSLLLLPIQEHLRQRSGVSVPIVDLFKYRTAGALAGHLERLQAAARPAEPERPAPIVRRPPGAGDPPASFVQEQLWFIDRLEPGSPVYNLPTAVRLDGDFDRAALRRALARLVERQAVLRTTLGSAQGRAIQVVAPRLVPALPEIDLTALAPAVRETAAAGLLAAEALLPFDLAAGPLFRANLLRLAADRHWLLVTFHHTITDGWSLRLFYEELGAFYGADVTNIANGANIANIANVGGAGDPGLPALAVQYADFAPWQRERLRGELLARLLAYWRQRLAGAPALLDLPLDRPRPPVQRYHGISELLEVDPEVAAALRAFAGGEGATLFMTLVAAYATLLHRYSGESDLVLGTPAANRWPAELEALLGFFANTLPLRLDLAGDPTFRDLLGRVRGSVLADLAQQEIPFEKIVEDLRPGRDLSHNPIYQVVFALETSPRPLRLDLPGLTMTPLPPVQGTAKFDLALYMGDHGGRLAGLFEANSDLVDRPTAVRWLRHFTTLAAAAVTAPERRLSELSFLAPAERRQLVERLAAAGRQVHVRGYRLDLGRIERLLAEHPAIDTAAVVVRPAGSAGSAGSPPAAGERLVAYFTVRPAPAAAATTASAGAAELRAFLAERLPEHMLPAAFVRLDELPLTAAGGLDHGALPAPEERPDAGVEALLPADEAERVVAEIWRGLLGVEEVGPRDNFFALGGHSLLLLPMQEELERRFGIRIPVVDLFKFPSAGALARRLAKAPAGLPPVEPESPAEQVRERAERTQAAVGRGRFADARRRVEAASRSAVEPAHAAGAAGAGGAGGAGGPAPVQAAAPPLVEEEGAG